MNNVEAESDPRLEADGLILAGGKGSRMGGRKALVPFLGKPLLAWAIDLLKPLCRSLLICGQGQGLDGFGLPLVADEIPDCGPAGGLASGLRAASRDWCLVVPCDAPLLPARLFRALWERREAKGAVIPVQVHGRLEPLCALYHREYGHIFATALARGERRLSTILGHGGYVEFPLDDNGFGEELFVNLNTPRELQAAAAASHHASACTSTTRADL